MLLCVFHLNPDPQPKAGLSELHPLYELMKILSVTVKVTPREPKKQLIGQPVGFSENGILEGSRVLTHCVFHAQIASLFLIVLSVAR